MFRSNYNKEHFICGTTSSLPHKDTRWDRICKRNQLLVVGENRTYVKTAAVRRFLEMDFISKKHDRALRGISTQQPLDPLLVMDMRHKMSRKLPRALPLATVAHMRNTNKCVTHNVGVEDHYITHELDKFRAQLERQHRQRNRINKKRSLSIKALLQLNNDRLRRSVEATAVIIHDFYAAPLEALQQQNVLEATIAKALEKKTNPNQTTVDVTSSEIELNDNIVKGHIEHLQLLDMQPSDARSHKENVLLPVSLRLRTPSPLTLTDEFLRPMLESVEEQKLQKRYVHFESPVEQSSPSTPIESCLYNHECSSRSSSNTSGGIDSVISELAEEAIKELQIEEENEQMVIKMSTVDFTETRESQTNINHQDFIIQGYQVSTVKNKLLPHLVGKISSDTDGSDDEQQQDTDNESISFNEQNIIITELFKSRRTHTNMVTLRRYFLKWMHFTTIQKIERENCSSRHDRVHMINAFLDKIRRDKVTQRLSINDVTHNKNNQPLYSEENKMPKSVVQAAKKYQNKIKVQQDIIDLQRLKLERQERMIMELKLNRLSEEAREARQELKNELKSVIRLGDAKTKAKAKCLQLIGNLRDAEDDRLQARGALLVPKFLQKMQERSLERSERHEQARQRRLQQEAEREAQKIAVEEAKRFEDEEAKRMRIEALREKRRQEKMAKVLKERERQKTLEQKLKAQDFYRHLLLHRIGFEVFRRALQRKRENQRKCEKFRQKHYQRTFFVAWQQHCALIRERQLTRSDDFYRRILKRRIMDGWHAYIWDARSQCNIAVDWYELHLTEHYFVLWFGYTLRMRAIEESKMRQAISHHEWHLKWKVLDCWQRLQQLLQLERETEERRQRWRMKIWELLPDYTPNRDELLWK